MADDDIYSAYEAEGKQEAETQEASSLEYPPAVVEQEAAGVEYPPAVVEQEAAGVEYPPATIEQDVTGVEYPLGNAREVEEGEFEILPDELEHPPAVVEQEAASAEYLPAVVEQSGAEYVHEAPRELEEGEFEVLPNEPEIEEAVYTEYDVTAENEAAQQTPASQTQAAELEEDGLDNEEASAENPQPAAHGYTAEEYGPQLPEEKEEEQPTIEENVVASGKEEDGLDNEEEKDKKLSYEDIARMYAQMMERDGEDSPMAQVDLQDKKNGPVEVSFKSGASLLDGRDSMALKVPEGQKPHPGDIKTIVDSGQERGWDCFNLKGSESFKEAMFVECFARDLDTMGYEPPPHVLERAEQEKAKRAQKEAKEAPEKTAENPAPNNEIIRDEPSAENPQPAEHGFTAEEYGPQPAAPEQAQEAPVVENSISQAEPTAEPRQQQTFLAAGDNKARAAKLDAFIDNAKQGKVQVNTTALAHMKDNQQKG